MLTARPLSDSEVRAMSSTRLAFGTTLNRALNILTHCYFVIFYFHSCFRGVSHVSVNNIYIFFLFRGKGKCAHGYIRDF